MNVINVSDVVVKVTGPEIVIMLPPATAADHHLDPDHPEADDIRDHQKEDLTVLLPEDLLIDLVTNLAQDQDLLLDLQKNIPAQKLMHLGHLLAHPADLIQDQDHLHPLWIKIVHVLDLEVR